MHLMQVYIEGRLQTRDYEDKTGRKVYVTEIVANQMQMLGGRNPETPEPDIGKVPEEDIPF